MISADQCMAGSLDMITPPALMLPRTEYEEAFLIGSVSGRSVAVFLRGERRFRAIPAESPNWQGAVLVEIRIELNPDSLFEPSMRDGHGAMIRTGDKLFLGAHEPNRYGRLSVLLSAGHKDCGAHAVVFRDWQVVTGEGLSRVMLWRNQTVSATG